MTDPLALLRANHRDLLDQQATLATRARHLATQVDAVTTELTEVTANIRNHQAVINLITTALNTQRQPTEPVKPARKKANT